MYIFALAKTILHINRGSKNRIFSTTSYWRSLFQNFTKLLFIKVVFANRKDYAFSCYNFKQF